MKQSKQRIYRLLPCGAYDVERIESWLADMAAQGWHLDAVASSIRLFRFAQGDARPVRYRLEPKRDYNDQSEKPEEAIREVYAACGWEAVADFGPFFIFRTDDPEARELHTDPAMHMEVYRRLLRRYFWCNIFVIVLTAAMIGFLGHDWYRRLVIMGPVFTLAHPMVLLPILCADVIWEFCRILGLYRRMKAGQYPRQDCPWRKWAFWHRAKMVGEKLLYVLFVLSLLVPLVNVVNMEKPLEEYPGIPPVITIAQLLPEGEYQPDDSLRLNGYEENCTWAASCNLFWQEDAQVVMPDGKTVSGLLIVTYHETAAPWIARGLAEEYLQEARHEKRYSPLELELPTIDFAAAYRNTGSPSVILCHGNKVVKATVFFPDDQEQMLALWIAKMEILLRNRAQ